MKRIKIKAILSGDKVKTGNTVTVKGWVRTFRNNQFIALNDGSTIYNLQVVLNQADYTEELIKKITTGACLSITGTLVESQGKGQLVEINATSIEIYGEANPSEYPLQPKKHSMEFLRQNSHLRMRTNTFGAVFRIRHALAYAVHHFFNQKGFFYLHTPIITASDAEGAGEMFRVTTLDIANPPKTEKGQIDFSKDFFERETSLTVSGQLEAEIGAMALGEVYTFGPTFRAENSNTSRHLAEFWMIEPEMAFYDLDDNMDLAEEMVKYLVSYVLENCNEDLQFLDTRFKDEENAKPQNERSDLSLLERLQFVVNDPFERITYTEAVQILLESKHYKKNKFKFPVAWGVDLQSEHEKYLVEKHFKKPVIVTNYPKAIKAFYMKHDPDGKTVRAMDVLFPGIGEVIGGSQREENLDRLLERMAEVGIPEHDIWWYLQLRKFGTAPHSGFGLGFDRFVQFVTGMGNIRDVIGFPRYPGHGGF